MNKKLELEIREKIRQAQTLEDLKPVYKQMKEWHVDAIYDTEEGWPREYSLMYRAYKRKSLSLYRKEYPGLRPKKDGCSVLTEVAEELVWKSLRSWIKEESLGWVSIFRNYQPSGRRYLVIKHWPDTLDEEWKEEVHRHLHTGSYEFYGYEECRLRIRTR